MKITSATAFALACAAIASAEELPRKTKAARESYPNADVIYDSVTSPDGKRLRTIITKPRNAKGKLPVIFVAGWFGWDLVGGAAGAEKSSRVVFLRPARLPPISPFCVC